MKQCPACARPHGVPYLRLAVSGAMTPSSCKACGCRFHPRSAGTTILIELVGFPLGVVIGLALPGIWPTVLALAFLVIAFMLVRWMLPLVVVAEPFEITPRRRRVE